MWFIALSGPQHAWRHQMLDEERSAASVQRVLSATFARICFVRFRRLAIPSAGVTIGTTVCAGRRSSEDCRDRVSAVVVGADRDGFVLRGCGGTAGQGFLWAGGVVAAEAHCVSAAGRRIVAGLPFVE
jgi:hypothetical protein